MSQLKCDGCRLRLQQDHIRTGPVLTLSCPSCGEPLQPAPRLDEIVGYRAIEGPLGDGLGDPTWPEARAISLSPPPDHAL